MSIKSVMVDGAEALKLMVDGVVAWERLQFIPCEYLASDGNQYLIIEDYTPQVGDDIRVSYIRERIINFETVLSAGTEDYQLIVLLSQQNSGMYVKYFSAGDATSVEMVGYAPKIPYHFHFTDNGKFTLNDYVNSGEVHKNKQPVNTPLHLFMRANLTSGFQGKILSFVVSRNGETILNLTPMIRRSDGKPGMLDTVAQKFYTNKGTGEFLYELV